MSPQRNGPGAGSRQNPFWLSYVDLMTALFLIMLVLFVLSYRRFQERENQLRVQLRQLQLIQRLESSVQQLMSDKTLFRYEPRFRRYTLARDIQFQGGQWDLRRPSQSLPPAQAAASLTYLRQTGRALRSLVDSLLARKRHDPALREVSYVLLIQGSASNLQDARAPRYDTYAYTSYENWGYILSYQRAKALHDFWRQERIADFDAPRYHGLLELALAGNGYGGVGRYNSRKRNLRVTNAEEKRNQRFLIQIIPKIGQVK
ncbi:hypothetical protein [uncultured Hymenobacter sp.]|uniref:hypothetical protein n=1 Tax=uncultured Hymenobacter sp. TaxID=170016 RepID=UPI0035C98329